MKRTSAWKKLCAHINHLRLTDKFLLIFMTILMIQSAHNLFFHEIHLQNSETLDVVIRTTTAAIFGYFLSSSFQHGSRDSSRDSDGRDKPMTLPPPAGTGNNMDMTIQSAGQEPQSTPVIPGYSRTTLKTGRRINTRTRQQIIIVSCIGIVSLILLVISSNLGEMPTSAIATLSQLRDFVSGSVGFLVGHSKTEK